MPDFNYFQKFPITQYDILGNGRAATITNILHRVRIRERLRTNSFIYYDYNVKDGETPEIIAHKYYGDSNLHWLILIANDRFDYKYDWVLSYNDFVAFLEAKYGTIQVAHQTHHHYENSDGLVIDSDTFTSLPANERLEVSAFDYETQLNESKRAIKLIDKVYVSTIVKELDTLLAEVS